MRFLHTADWHLGRTLGGHSLRQEQEALLTGDLPAMVRDARPDAVLVAGDIYDRAVPPAEFVRLLDDVLGQLVLGLRVPVILIPGNHDEARRLSFGARLMEAARLHVVADACGRAVTLPDAEGDVTVLALGYATPAVLAREAALEGSAFSDHDGAYAALAPRLHGMCPDGGRRVLVAHAFVAGGAESRDSERALSVGGSGAVSADRFEGFQYVALGHLHRPQAMCGGRVRYSGSLFPYSVEEADHAKSATLVELDAAGGVRTEALPFSPRRGLRVVQGSFAHLRDDPPGSAEDYVAIVLTDPVPVPEAQRRLSEAFPRIVSLRYAAVAGPSGTLATPDAAARAERPLDLFGRFHAEMRNAPLPEEAVPVLVSAIGAAEDA